MADNNDEPEFMDDDSGDAASPAADQATFEDAGAGASSMEPDMTTTRTLGQPLSDFLMTLEDYTPTVLIILPQTLMNLSIKHSF